MPIIRHGYSSSPNKDSYKRAQNRRILLANATHCHICGQPARHDDPLEADHITPVSRGGSDEFSNLRPAHRSCNRRRGQG